MSNSVTPPLCDWGAPFFDEQKIPALRYSPPAIPPGEAPFVTGFVAGNNLVKLLATGDGAVFPCLLNGPPQLLCGDPVDRAFSGAGRLFAYEAGRVKEVVGPEHPMAGRSGVETAGLVLAPSYVEKEFAAGELLVRHRIAVSLSGLPAIVVLYIVTNRSSGTRWISLFDFWDVAPYILDAEFLKPSFGSKVAGALKLSKGLRLDNKYLTTTVQDEGGSVRFEFPWAEGFTRRAATRNLAPIPPLNVVRLTKNLSISATGVPEELAQAMAEGQARPKGADWKRLCARSEFSLGPGATETAAAVHWYGDWEEGKKQLRSLLPISMFSGNEALLWGRRRGLALETRGTQFGSSTDWETSWHAGVTAATPWKDFGSGEIVMPRGRTTFLDGGYADNSLVAASLVASSYLAPASVGTVFVSEAERVLAEIGPEPKKWRRNGPGLADLLHMLWAGCEYVAASGGGSTEAREQVRRMAELALKIASDDVLWGANGLVQARWSGEHQALAGAPSLSGKSLKDLETMYSSALLAVTSSWTAAIYEEDDPKLSDDLVAMVASLTPRLEERFRDPYFPRWVLPTGKPADPRFALDHHVWLMLLPIANKLKDKVLWNLEHQFAGVPTPWLPTVENARMTAPDNVEPGRGHAGGVSLLVNALAVWAVARQNGQSALKLYARTGVENLMRFRTERWTAPIFDGSAQGRKPDSKRPASRLRPFSTGLNTFALAKTLATIKLVALGPGGNGVYVKPGLLKGSSLSTGALDLSLSDKALRGTSRGLGDEADLIVDFESGVEASKWQPDQQHGVLKFECRGGHIMIKVKTGEAWVLRRSD